jgi:hypothetical protein
MVGLARHEGKRLPHTGRVREQAGLVLGSKRRRVPLSRRPLFRFLLKGSRIPNADPRSPAISVDWLSLSKPIRHPRNNVATEDGNCGLILYPLGVCGLRVLSCSSRLVPFKFHQPDLICQMRTHQFDGC